MVARFLVMSCMVLVQYPDGGVLVGWEDAGVELVLYKFGVVQLGGGDDQ